MSEPKILARKSTFIFAAGSAMGLGDLWKFSYMIRENGSGAFVAPLLIALVFVSSILGEKKMTALINQLIGKLFFIINK